MLLPKHARILRLTDFYSFLTCIFVGYSGRKRFIDLKCVKDYIRDIYYIGQDSQPIYVPLLFTYIYTSALYFQEGYAEHTKRYLEKNIAIICESMKVIHFVPNIHTYEKCKILEQTFILFIQISGPAEYQTWELKLHSQLLLLLCYHVVHINHFFFVEPHLKLISRHRKTVSTNKTESS